MDCLAGLKTTGTLRGDIWVDGHPKEQDTFKRVCGRAPAGAAHVLQGVHALHRVLAALVWQIHRLALQHNWLPHAWLPACAQIRMALCCPDCVHGLCSQLQGASQG